MPAAQVINLNGPRDELTALQRTAESFSQRFMENRDKQQESDALKAIYGKYQDDAQMIQKRAQDINADPNISPTMKVQSVNQMVQLDKQNQELQKQLRDQIGKKALIAGIEKERGFEPGSLAHFESDPKMAELATRPVREPRKTQASQPIDPEQQRLMKEVESTEEYQKAPLPRKHQMMRENNVSKENADAAIKYYAEDEKLNFKQQKNDQEFKHKIHKDSEEYDDKVLKAYESAKHQLTAIKDVSQSIENADPTSFANIFRTIGGQAGKALSNALLSKDEATIQASIPAFLEGRKELFGVRLSDADLALLSDKLPDMGKSKEANKAILKIMEKYSKASVLKYQVAKEIKKENNGFRRINYKDEVEERFAEKMEPVQVINPKNGKKITIPAYELEAALKAEARLVNE
jgi:hypothetical protein